MWRVAQGPLSSFSVFKFHMFCAVLFELSRAFKKKIENKEGAAGKIIRYKDSRM